MFRQFGAPIVMPLLQVARGRILLSMELIGFIGLLSLVSKQ